MADRKWKPTDMITQKRAETVVSILYPEIHELRYADPEAWDYTVLRVRNAMLIAFGHSAIEQDT